MFKCQALKIIGGFSAPGKMDCPGFGLQALVACPVGSMLREIENSVCSKCYACKGRYVFPGVIAAQQRRKAAIEFALSSPEAYRMYLDAWGVSLKGVSYFRFHDSGDVFSPAYGELLISIAMENSNTSIWIPTKQKMFAYKCNDLNVPNLIVRLSAQMINEEGDQFIPSSSVVSDVEFCGSNSMMCPATIGKIKNCTECGRKCWSKSVQSVCYLKH